MERTDGGAEWWRRGVIYQIYPRSFADSDGDGVGDLRGVASRLDHLNDGTPSSLGVSGVWLSPFYRSPQLDFGYDVSDYCDVAPLFGSLSDFDRLLATAHARGIKVLVDLVPNHTSDRHPWFQESRSSRASPKRDWYVWADSGPGGAPPNNWLSSFESAGPAWTFDALTGQWYLHSFTPSQPDLNWWNPDVRAAMDQVMRFWLDRGVDGFRIDVAHRLAKDPALGDNPPEVATLRRDYGVHSAPMRNIDWPETHEVLRGFRRTTDEFGAVAVGEVGLTDLRRMVGYYGAGDQLQMVFNFSFWQQPWDAGAFRGVVDRVESLLPDEAWPVYALSNHDLPRAISRYGAGDLSAARARLAAMMLLTLRGTPFLYYGEEIGMTDFAPPLASDPDGRDACRTPMQWTGGPGAGFTTGTPWLPIPETAAHVNVASADTDPGSLLNLYRRLIRLRRTSVALHLGSYSAFDVESADVYLFERRGGDERVVVALNFSDQRVVLRGPTLEATPPLVRLASTRSELPSPTVSLDRLELAPLEGVILRDTTRGGGRAGG